MATHLFSTGLYLLVASAIGALFCWLAGQDALRAFSVRTCGMAGDARPARLFWF